MPRTSTLQRVLGLSFIAAATLPLLFFGWFAHVYLAGRQLAAAKANLHSHAQNIRDEADEFYNQVEASLLLIRELVDNLHHTPNPTAVDVHLQTVVNQSRHFEAIYLLDADLKVRSLGLPEQLATRRRDYLGLDFSGLDLLPGITSRLVTAAENPAGIARSDTFVSVATGKPSVMLMIRTSGGYLLGTVDLDRLSDYLRRRMRQSEAMVFAVTDHNGTLIAHTDQRLALERTSYLNHPEVRDALATGTEVAGRYHEDRTLLESVSIVPRSGWVVHASLRREDALRDFNQLRAVLFSSLVVAGVLGGGLAFRQARRVLRPLRTLRDGTQGVERGDYRGLERIGGTGYAELDDLSANFLEMGAAVIERETFLRASEERYRSLVAGMGEGLLIVSDAGRITDCNEAAERILSLPRHQLIGAALPIEPWRIIREDGTPCPAEEYPFAVTLSRGQTIDNQLIGLCRPDGRETWLQINCRPQRSLQGEVVAAVVTFADVSRLKAAEASLRLGKLRYQELSQQFSALLGGITDRISLISPELRVVWSNHDLRQDDDNLCCYQVFSKRRESCPDCPALRAFASGRQEAGEVVDARGRRLLLRAFPVLGEAGAVRNVVMICEDVTDKYEGERQRIRAGQLAALGELAAGVAHEINNPISGVINYAQLIVNRAAAGSREHELAQRIIREGDRIARIVRELLIFAREESSETKVVSVREALAEALTLCESQLNREGIALRIDLPPELPRVESRSHHIQQLLLNLISNARHALTDRYPQPHPDKILEIGARQIDIEGVPYVRLKIRDHGVGIPPELLERVMNPFVTTKPAGVGTGLGLSISFEIAKKHGGSLSIASEHGAWTEVTVELPAGRSAVTEGATA